MRTPLEIAIYAAGGYKTVAEKLDPPVTPQAVGQWAKADRVPANKCLQMEKIIGMSRYAMRPDVYGEPPAVEAAA